MDTNYKYDPGQKLYGTKFGDLGDFSWAYRWNIGNENDITNRFAVTFSTDKGNYTFIPQEVVNKGFVSVGNNNQYFFNKFLDPEFISSFDKNAQAVDLKGIVDPASWGYINNTRPTNLKEAAPGNKDFGYGWSGKGYLVPESKMNEWFNQGVWNSKSYELGKNVGKVSTGEIQGIAVKDGQYVYVPQSSGGSAYIPSDGKTYANWQENRWGGIVGDILGGLHGMTADLGPVLPIALSFIAPGIGSAIGSALAPAASAAVQAAIGSAVIGGTVAEATGGDFLKGALTSAVGSGIGSATAPITSSISEAVGSQALGQALAGGAMAELQGGDFVQGAIQGGLSGAINDAKLAAAEEYLKSIPPEYTYESDLPTLNVVPGDTIGIVESPIDTSFKPDYSLSATPVIPEMGAQGIQVPTINEVIDVVNQPVDYSLPVPTTNVGLVIPTTPNIESMGGGQGITVPVTGGTLTEAGVIPETYIPALGDESSFINQPVPEVSVNIPEIVEQPKDISGELAALDAAKALVPLAAGALTAGAVVNAIQEDQPTGFEIVPIPADWRSPEYNMAFTPSAPIDFGTAELLRGTQWENPQIQAPRQYTLTDVINALNYQSVPFVQQNYEIPQVQMSIPDILEQFNVAPTVGVNDIIGNLGGRPMSIADIISGIQSGQNYGS